MGPMQSGGSCKVQGVREAVRAGRGERASTGHRGLSESRGHEPGNVGRMGGKTLRGAQVAHSIRGVET